MEIFVVILFGAALIWGLLFFRDTPTSSESVRETYRKQKAKMDAEEAEYKKTLRIKQEIAQRKAESIKQATLQKEMADELTMVNVLSKYDTIALLDDKFREILKDECLKATGNYSLSGKEFDKVVFIVTRQREKELAVAKAESDRINKERELEALKYELSTKMYR